MSGPDRTGIGGGGDLVPEDASFVGRAAELDRLKAFFDEGRRLVSIVGPPGVGKTRLSRRFARSLVEARRIEGGGWFVRLRDATTAADVTHRVSQALDLALSVLDDQAAAVPLAGAIARRGELMVVLDDADHAVEALGEMLPSLLGRAPNLRLVVTSRERLRLSSEQVIELFPLETPAAGDREPDVLGGVEAVQLFVDRVRSVRPDYSTDSAELARVAEIVRCLEGFPLAIELAAARMSAIDTATLLKRLEERFEVLSHAPRDGEPHHQSLEAALESSWTMLEPWEQACLAGCTVFRGGFELAAAERVVAVGEGAPPVLDVLQALRDRSLLVVRTGVAGSRFDLYDSVRDFAARRLEEPLEALELRHARWCVEEGERRAGVLERSGTKVAFAALRAEADNLRAVVERSRDREHAGRAILALDSLLHLEGPADAHFALLDRARTGLPTGSSLADQLSVRRVRAMARWRGAERALEAAGESCSTVGPLKVALLVHTGRTAEASEALSRLESDAACKALLAARIDRQAGRWRASVAGLRETAASDDCVRVEILVELTESLLALGRSSDARRAIGEALPGSELLADVGLRARVHAAAGRVSLEEAALHRARQLLVTSRELARRAQAPAEEADAAEGLGQVALDEGDPVTAGASFEEAVASFGTAGRPHRVAAASVLQTCARADPNRAHSELVELLDDSRLPPPGRALASARLGVGHASAGREGPAARALRDAAALADRLDDGVVPRVVALASAHLDILRGERAEARDDSEAAGEAWDAARARLLEALRPSEAELGVRTSVLLRHMARSVLGKLPALERARVWADALDGDGSGLVVEASRRWFRPPGGHWIDLGKKRLLSRLLSRLLDERADRPGEPVETAELVDHLWPGQSLLPDAAAGRVYTAVAQLRRFGLAEVLEKNPDGYRLDATVDVIEVPRPL